MGRGSGRGASSSKGRAGSVSAARSSAKPTKGRAPAGPCGVQRKRDEVDNSDEFGDVRPSRKRAAVGPCICSNCNVGSVDRRWGDFDVVSGVSKSDKVPKAQRILLRTACKNGGGWIFNFSSQCVQM